MGTVLFIAYRNSGNITLNSFVGILICGCKTACVDKTDVRGLARKWIVIAGNSVDLDNEPEEVLADIVVRKLKLSATSHDEC